MATDKRISLLGARFMMGKIQELADLFKIVPMTVLAEESGLSSYHKMKHLDTLLITELRTLTKLTDIPPSAYIKWSENQDSRKELPQVKLDDVIALKTDLVRDRIGLGKLHIFSEIFDILPKTVLASLLNLNNNKMSLLIEHPGLISLKQVKQMAHIFELEPLIFFKLIDNVLLEREGKAIKPLKATIKLPRKTYEYK